MDAVRAMDRLTRSIEDFNSVFIRLPASDRLSFSALSVLLRRTRRTRTGGRRGAGISKTGTYDLRGRDLRPLSVSCPAGRLVP